MASNYRAFEILFLQDAGYGGTSLFAADDDQEEDFQKIDDEVCRVYCCLQTFTYLRLYSPAGSNCSMEYNPTLHCCSSGEVSVRYYRDC